MKIIALLRIVVFAILAPWCARAQTDAGISPVSITNYVMMPVTNWSEPEPGLRSVNGQIYNPEIGQVWQSITIPEGAHCLGARYYGSVQPIDVTFVWGSLEHQDHQSIQVFNYPYNPRDFRRGRDGVQDEFEDVVAAHPLYLRVLPVNIQTNWTPLGRARIGDRTYDYGLPYTNRIPVVTWQRVPVEEVPRRELPRPTVPMQTEARILPPVTASSYVTGDFSNRLSAIQAIDNPSRRDLFLERLATEAAHQGDVATVEQCIAGISTQIRHDNAAHAAAMVLNSTGKANDAATIAGMISQPTMRNMVLNQINAMNR